MQLLQSLSLKAAYNDRAHLEAAGQTEETIFYINAQLPGYRVNLAKTNAV